MSQTEVEWAKSKPKCDSDAAFRALGMYRDIHDPKTREERAAQHRAYSEDSQRLEAEAWERAKANPGVDVPVYQPARYVECWSDDPMYWEIPLSAFEYKTVREPFFCEVWWHMDVFVARAVVYRRRRIPGFCAGLVPQGWKPAGKTPVFRTHWWRV